MAAVNRKYLLGVEPAMRSGAEPQLLARGSGGSVMSSPVGGGPV